MKKKKTFSELSILMQLMLTLQCILSLFLLVMKFLTQIPLK